MCFQWGLECEGGPNITGQYPNNDDYYERFYSGAFYIGSERIDGYSDANSAAGKTGLFRASRSSSIYGSSSTVQPPALRLTFCIKT